MSKFKDEKGRLRTQSLFIDYQYDPEIAIYTLKDEDFEYKGKVFPSLKRLYLEIADPTEWEFAQRCFANWDQWQRIANTYATKNNVAKWREELEIKLKSEAIKEMRNKAQDPKGTSAARWLAEKGWEEKRTPGAPSKEEKERQINIDKRVKDELDEDIERMRPWH